MKKPVIVIALAAAALVVIAWFRIERPRSGPALHHQELNEGLSRQAHPLANPEREDQREENRDTAITDRGTNIERAFRFYDQKRIQERIESRRTLSGSHSWDVLDITSGFREKRLLVLGFPEEALAYYGPRAFGKSSCSWYERDEALLAMEILSETHREDARAVLIQLAQDLEFNVSQKAIRSLRYYHDPETASLLIQIGLSDPRKVLHELATCFSDFTMVHASVSQFQATNTADSEMLGRFQRRLGQLADLQNPKNLEDCLLNLEEPEEATKDIGARELLEYLAIARRIEVVPLLRRRADELFRKEIGMTPEEAVLAAHDLDAEAPTPFRFGEHRTFREAYQDFVEGALNCWPTYNETIIAIVRLGGTVTEWERARLAHFGYAGNPRSAAEELLKSIP